MQALNIKGIIMKKELLALSLLVLTGCSMKRDLPVESYDSLAEYAAKSYECLKAGYLSYPLQNFASDISRRRLSEYNFDKQKLQDDAEHWRNKTSPSKLSCMIIERESKKLVADFQSELPPEGPDSYARQKGHIPRVYKHPAPKTYKRQATKEYPTYNQVYNQVYNQSTAPSINISPTKSPSINLPSVSKPNTNSSYLNKQHQTTPKVYQSLTSSVRNGNSIVCTYSLGRIKYVKIHERCPTSLY
jgi:hypothetical protein